MSKDNRFKIVAKDVGAKQRFSSFIISNSKPNIAVDKIISLATKYRILILKDLDEYESGNKYPKSRLFKVYLFKLFILLTGIRYLLSSVFNSKSMIIVMSDANYLLGNQRLISALVCMAAFAILVLMIILQHQEMTRSAGILTFLNTYKQRRVIQLNELNTRRLAFRTNLMVKYFIRQAFWPLVISVMSLFVFFGTVAYLDPNTGFVLILVIIWWVIFFIFLLQFFALISIGFVVCTLCTLYLKYKFMEINQMVASSLEFRNKSLLMKAITEHNLITNQTQELNGFFCWITFVLYYLATPPIMLLMYIIHAEDTKNITRFVAAFVWIIIFIIIFTVNLLSSLINRWAHRPYHLLYTFLIRNRVNTKQLMRITAFIEKLGGPDIGFYCWNLFPMNNYQFYQYVANCGATYFLILEMISNM